MTALDAQRVAAAIASSLSGPGGIALVVNVFANVPGVVHSPPRRSLFRSDPERIQIGEWRYEIAKDGRLTAAHVVNDIVIAEETLPAHSVGPHIARALDQLVINFGPAIIPNIEAAVDVLLLSGG